jgi:hypothetical protein
MTSKRNEWIALALFPFKAYVVVVFPFYGLFHIFCPQPLTTYIGNNTTVTDPTVERFLQIFALCGVFLLLGFIVQIFIGDQKSAIRTLMFAIAPGGLCGFIAFMWVVAHLL